MNSAPLDDAEFLKLWGFTSSCCCLCQLDIRNTGGHLLQCARCKVAHYCSLDCLQKDFVKHKEVCLLAYQAKLKILEEQAATTRQDDPYTPVIPNSSDCDADIPPVKDIDSTGTDRAATLPGNLTAPNAPNRDNGEPLDGKECSGSSMYKDQSEGTNAGVGNTNMMNSEGLSPNSSQAIDRNDNHDDESTLAGDDRFPVDDKQNLTVGKLTTPESPSDAAAKAISVGKLPVRCDETTDKQLPSCSSKWNGNEKSCEDSIEASTAPRSDERTNDSHGEFPNDEKKDSPMEDMDYISDQNLGNIDFAQYSPNTCKRLISVGKLPASCMEFFDGNHPSASGRFVKGDRGNQTPTKVVNRNGTCVDKKRCSMGDAGTADGTQQLRSFEGSSNCGSNQTPKVSNNCHDELLDCQDPSLSPSRQVGRLQTNDIVGESCLSGRQVGKLPQFDDEASQRNVLSPGKLRASAFQQYGDGDWKRGISRSPRKQEVSAEKGQLVEAYSKSPRSRLNASLMQKFDGHDKAPKAELGTCVDRLPHEATDCFEQPPLSPCRPQRSPGKLPSFAMRAFAPRTSSQDKLPPAFSKLKHSPQRKWKCYKPKPNSNTEQSLG